jgi:DNA primase
MSGYIEEHIIERVREQADVVQTISDYVLLKKAGSNYKGLCPFHSEKTPSFVVNPEKQIYHCFGCGEGGNVFSFIMKWENLSFPEAVKHLAERHGIKISFNRKSRAEHEKTKAIEQLYYITLAAAKYYHRLLTELPQGQPARQYLKSRGVSDKTISKFLLGYAPFAWDQLVRQLQSQGFSLEEVARTGLIKARETGKGYYDTFRSRLIFPIQNVRGKFVAFGGRTLNEDDPQVPKYINSPESPVYEKGANLYGLNLAYEQIRKQKDAILVEGYMDLITAHQAGVGNVVATLGTAITRRQAKLLKRFSPQVTLVFDADAAGRAAAEKGHGVFLEEGLKVKAATLPQGSDPDSFIKQRGAEAFTREIDGAPPLMEFIINSAVKEHDLSSVEGRVDCVNRVLPFLTSIENNVERSEYIRLLSERVSIPEGDIRAELRRSASRGGRRPPGTARGVPERPIPKKDRFASAEEQLIELLMHQKDLMQIYGERLKPELFKLEEHRKIVEAVCGFASGEGFANPSRLIDTLEGEGARELASKIAMRQVDLDDWQRTASHCLELLEERASGPGVSTLERLNRVTLELKEAERKGREDIGPLLKELQELRARLKSEKGERQLLRNEKNIQAS